MLLIRKQWFINMAVKHTISGLALVGWNVWPATERGELGTFGWTLINTYQGGENPYVPCLGKYAEREWSLACMVSPRSTPEHRYEWIALVNRIDEKNLEIVKVRHFADLDVEAKGYTGTLPTDSLLIFFGSESVWNGNIEVWKTTCQTVPMGILAPQL